MFWLYKSGTILITNNNFLRKLVHCAVGANNTHDLFTASNLVTTNPFIQSHVIRCVHMRTAKITDVYAMLRNTLKQQLVRAEAVTPSYTNT
jgi:hypothetical protein